MLAVIATACKQPSELPGQPQQSQTTTPAAQTSPTPMQTEMDVASAAVKILNSAHRSGGIILHADCTTSGMPENFYVMRPPVKLEPMDAALQEISAQYQDIYWRESRESGVRVIDGTAKPALLKVHVKEFRIVEDREPDAALAALWATPEVAAFLRRAQVHMPRRGAALRKVLSPPMTVQLKNATVADILDHIAGAYHASPPKVWVYRECTDKPNRKETLVDVQVR